MSCPRTSWSWARCSAASTSASAGQCTNRSVRTGSAMRSRWLNRGGRCQPGDTAPRVIGGGTSDERMAHREVCAEASSSVALRIKTQAMGGRRLGEAPAHFHSQPIVESACADRCSPTNRLEMLPPSHVASATDKAL